MGVRFIRNPCCGDLFRRSYWRSGCGGRMMVDISKRPTAPWHLWAIAAASVLWNGVGVWQWYQKVTGAQAYWSALTMEQVFYLRSAPMWTDVAFGVAVWCGLLGALMLLLRRSEERRVGKEDSSW